MRRYLWATIGFAVAALLLMSAFAVLQLSRGLAAAEAASRDRMRDLAEYMVDHLREDIFSYTFVLTPESLPKDFAVEKSEWLRRLAKPTGLERVAMTDSNGEIYISSTPELRSGANIRPYLLDRASFDRARHERLPVFSHGPGSVSRQLLYYPFDFFGTLHVVVLESDANLLRQFASFRSFLYGLGFTLLLTLSVLVGAILVLERRAQAAWELSRRHEQLAFLGRTSAELAHELKNPLAVMKTSIDVLRRQYDPESAQPAFRFLSEESMRLGRIITNILGFSRGRNLQTRPVALAELFDRALNGLRGSHSEVNVTRNIPETVRVMADEDAARQVLENLLHNAAQAAGPRGKILVRAESGSEKVRLWLADTGPGIPKPLRTTLFDPFVTGSRTGSGLGLAIVKSLCERMEWKVVLASEGEARKHFRDADFENEQLGACFELTLPLAGHQA